jgi:hypothetical protein
MPVRCPSTGHHVASSSDSVVNTIKLKRKKCSYCRHVVSTTTTTLRFLCFNIIYHTSFQEPKFIDVSVAPTSQVRASVRLVIPVVGNFKLWCLGGVQWRDVYIKLLESRWGDWNLSGDGETVGIHRPCACVISWRSLLKKRFQADSNKWHLIVKQMSYC